MLRKMIGVLGFTGIVMSVGALTAVYAEDAVPFPNGFQNWFLVNAITATKESSLFNGMAGLHLVHVNEKGMAALKVGGPYPDGTIFADDVHDFSMSDAAYIEGAKQAATVMIKDSKKYAATGGWGFQVWAGGDPSKPLIPDLAHTVDACYVCHTQKKDHDFVFSTYIP